MLSPPPFISISYCIYYTIKRMRVSVSYSILYISRENTIATSNPSVLLQHCFNAKFKANMQANNNTDSPKEPPVSAKFANGWLDDLDGRLILAKELRQRYQTLTNDLGGVDCLSYAQRSLCERALWLEYWLATQEKELANGDEFDVGKWVQAANSLQGIFAKLGLERVARNVPDLQDWIKRREAVA